MIMQSRSVNGLFHEPAGFRNNWAILATIALLVANVLTGVAESANNFINGTPEQLSTALKNQDWSVVLFYSSLCPHCKNLMPNFDKVSYLLSNTEGKKIIRVNCQEYPQLIIQYNITFFPWLGYYQKNEFKEVFDLKAKVINTPPDIVDWIIAHHSKPVTKRPVDSQISKSKSSSESSKPQDGPTLQSPKMIYTAQVQAQSLSLESPSIRHKLLKQEHSLQGFNKPLFSIQTTSGSKPIPPPLPKKLLQTSAPKASKPIKQSNVPPTKVK
jgi:thiol-disulfide isomerase/thioredoxin